MRSGEQLLTGRYPWSVALLFGLFHGLGFAGALIDFGLPQNEIALALLMFNVGVETGQILFVIVVLGCLANVRRFEFSKAQVVWRLMPYGVGSLSAFWTFDRFLAMF